MWPVTISQYNELVARGLAMRNPRDGHLYATNGSAVIKLRLVNAQPFQLPRDTDRMMRQNRSVCG